MGGGGRGGNSVASLGASSGASNSIIPNSGRIVNDGQAISNVELLSSMATRKLLNQRAHEFADKMTAQTRSAQEALEDAAVGIAMGGLGQAVTATVNRARQAGTNSTVNANEQTEGSTSINTDPTVHTPVEQSVIDAYQAAADSGLVDFMQDSIAHKGENARRYQLNNVSDRAADDILRIAGVDVRGNKTVIEQRIAEHIYHDHGPEGLTDHSMKDINDFARIQFVLDNYDSVADGGYSTAYNTNKSNGRSGPAKTVVFQKAVNGTYYVVEAVPDTKKKTVFINSAYMGSKKAEALHSADVAAVSGIPPAITSKTSSTDASTTSIPNSSENVNDGQAISNVELLSNMATRKLLNQRAHEFADKMTAQTRSAQEAQDGVFAAEQQTTPASREGISSRDQIGDLGAHLTAENAEQGQELDVGDDYIHAEHHGNVLDGIRKHFNEVDSMENVANLTGNEFQKTPEDNRNLRQKVIEFFNLLGNRVHRPGFGDIALNDAGVRDSLNHGYGKLKAATFASLPDVLRDGKVTNHDPKYKGRGYESFLIAAPVSVDGERCYVGALVIKDANTQRYKVHEVLTVNKNGTQAFQTEAGVPAGDSGTAYRSEALASNSIIPNSGRIVNDGRAISNVEMLSDILAGNGMPQTSGGNAQPGISMTQGAMAPGLQPTSNVELLAEILARDNDTMREPQKRELSDSPSAQDTTTSEKSESVEWNPAIGFETWTEPVKKAVYSTEYDIRHDNTEAGILYDRNGQFLFRQDGMNDMVRFNNQQLLLMKDGILTHNHPNGGCFSPDDINMLHHRNLGEVRAITSQGIYRLQSPEKWAKEIDNLEKIEKVYYDIDSQMSTPYYDKARKGELSFQEAEILGQEATVQEFCNRYGIPFQFDSWDSIWEASK